MRFILSLFVLFAFAAPSMASDIDASPKPVLVKGSKSYQVRYATPAKSPEFIEPAAGSEADAIPSEDASKNTYSDNGKTTPKPMKLHGKK